MGCDPTLCFPVKAIIPDIHGLTNTYSLNPTGNIPGCFPVYVQPNDPAGTPTNLTIDDRYSGVINIGFPFPFYGVTYPSLLVSTNGYISFNIFQAGQFSHWDIVQGTTPVNLPSATFYDPALIMGPYHDLYPGQPTSPMQRVQYQVFGTAPHRRWVLSFYKVPLFSCTSLIENTHQIILYESTGIIEVAIFSKQICTGWNEGRAMIGIQDHTRTQGMMAPNRRATDPPWGSIGMNESWRFIPNSGPTLFKRVELLDAGGTILSTGTTVPAGPGQLEASFPAICPPLGAVTPYIIRSVYAKIDDPLTEIYGLDTIRVSRITGVTATTNATGTSCNGASDGSITINPTSGTAPYTFEIDGGAPQNGTPPYTFSNLAPGPHTIVVTDANNCSYTTTLNVAAGPTVTAMASKVDASCNGTATGSITVSTPSPGQAPFEYSLDGTNWQSSNIFNNIPAGTYTVYFRSAEGCPGQTNITINEPPVLNASGTTSNGTCDGVNDGSITVMATGGNSGGYQYSIDGSTFQSSPVFNVNPGNYMVTVKDNLGCTTSFPVTVGLTSNLAFTPQTDALICEGTSTQLELLSNGTQYAWSPATGLSDTSIYNPVANPVITTQYIVTTTLGRCSERDTVIVNVNPAPVPDAGPDGYICYGQTYQLQGSGGTQYAWSPSTYLDNDQVASPVSSATRDMVYTLSILSDINGCASLVTDDMRLDVTPPIKVTTYPFDTVAYNGDVFQLMATTNDSDVINYSWTPATGLSDPYVASPMVTAGAIGDVVQYQVTTSTLAGCKGFGYVTVRVYKGPDIYMPTAFTPNNDGRNDRFTPFPVGIQKLNYFRVYNRWGQLLFSTNQLHHGWDGRLQGIEQQTGTYVWMVEGVTLDNRVITKKGTVTMIR